MYIKCPIPLSKHKRVTTSPSSLFMKPSNNNTPSIWIQGARSLNRYIGSVIQGPKDPWKFGNQKLQWKTATLREIN